MKKIATLISAVVFAVSGFAANVFPTKVPVILVQYKDVHFASGNDKTAFNNFFNGDSYTYNGATGSVKKYFSDQSYGKFVPQFDIIGPVTLVNNRSFYGNNDTYGDDEHAEGMVTEACQLADAQGTNFAQYDLNGDGYIDAVIVVYAGEGESATRPEYVYPMAGYLDEEILIDNKYIETYAYVPELRDMTNRAGIGEMVYQFSHLLGLPTLSDTDGGKEKTLGDWDVMDHGCYNNNGNTPAAYSAYERFYLGWVEPILLNEPMNVRLNNLNTNGDCAIVTKSGQANMLGDNPDPRKFYILENRQQTGWDKYLPGHGLLLTEINFVKSRWDGDEVNVQIKGKASHLVDLIEADENAPTYKDDNPNNGYFGKAGDAFPAGATSKLLFSNSWQFDDVKEASGVVTFAFQGGVSSGCTVTFYAGSNGTATKSEEKESKPFAGVTLPSVTPKSGYTFLGWASRKTSMTPDAGQAGDKFYPLSDCSVFALYRNDKRIDINYSAYRGVDWVSGATAYADRGKAFEIVYEAAEGYQTPAAATCLVKVVCGAKELNNYSFENDKLVIRFTAEQAIDNVSITIINSRYQDENGCASYDYAFSKACLSGAQELNGYEWQVRFGNPETYTGYNKSLGAQFGSGSNPTNGLSFFTSETTGCGVKRVEVEASMGSGGDAMLDVYLAGDFIGNTKELTETTTTYIYELDEPQSGSVEIAFTNTMKAIYVKRIAIYYEYIDPVAPVDPTQVEMAQEQISNTNLHKVLRNGQLYILRDNEVYTILGTKVQ